MHTFPYTTLFRSSAAAMNAALANAFASLEQALARYA
jgi:hypothetical protein